MSTVRDRLKAKLAAKNGEVPPAPEVSESAPVEAPKVAPANAKKKAADAQKAALVARLQKQKEAAAEQRAAEAEEKRLFDEEQARFAAERKEAEDKKAAEAEARRIEREILRKEGKLLTAKQQEQKDRADRMRENLIAQGLFDPNNIVKASDASNGTTGGAHSNKPKQPTKTKAQLEAERIKQEQEKKELERRRIYEDACEFVNTQNVDLINEKNTLATNVADIEAEILAIVAKINDLTLSTNANDDEEELDDWEAEDAADSEKEAALAEIAKLTAEKETKESALQAKQEEYAEASSNMDQLYRAQEQALLKKMEAAKKEEEMKKAEEERLLLNPNANMNLRSPIIVILGHVDSGKTSLLDKIRNSQVAKGEAGGITQQIGATFIPGESIKKMCAKLPEDSNIVEKLKLPGVLCIDTPGHESFSMLRSRGSDICDMAILVVDIQKGLQQQTLESIEILRERKTPFIVAITKIDGLYGWDKNEKNAFNPIETSLNECNEDTKYEFQKLMNHAVASFAEQRLNAAPFYSNPDSSKYISLVPVSSKTGEGLPDLLNLLCELTQTRMEARLQKGTAQFRCTILEVKNLDGHGTTLDCILVNGTIKEGDTIVCAGLSGPVVTQVRSLLTPPPLKDQKTKVDYIVQKSVHAAMGFKISAPNLGQALAGSDLFVLTPRDNLEDLKDQAQEDLQAILSRLDTDNNGVFVHASSLGSLEALLTFLRASKIPISGFDIGTVHKASISKASIQLDKKKPEYALILAFDVKVDADAQLLADKMDVKIFSKDVIYHLYDMCMKHFAEIKEKQRATTKPVFPCVVKPMGKNFVFHNTDPLVLGLKVVAGSLRIGTPLFIPQEENLQIGRVASMKKDNVDVEIAHKNDEVSVSIDQKHLSSIPVYGRHFEDKFDFISFMNRANIDNLREYYKEDLTEVDNKMMDKFLQLKYAH